MTPAPYSPLTATLFAAGMLLAPLLPARAELRLPAIIGDHMVLQQKQPNPLWGWDTPGTVVAVSFAGQEKSATADATGRWTVKLDPLPANASPSAMTIKGTSQRELKDILVGEVWICSGQSNMQWEVRGSWDGDLESMTAKFPRIRLISVPQVGTQELKDDFNGAWAESTPETAGGFSAVGFFFGRVLHQALDVPVGLIDNAWGGSAAEAWIRREAVEKDGRFADLMARWKELEAQAAAHPNEMNGNSRPGNIFGGVLHPTLGYGIRGAIWYQGESNAGRAWEYRSLFPFMISQWRKEWQQGDFPFYWVQLADFMDTKAEPGESAWAELREAQTLTQSAIPHGGQAVIIDLGEANDIHPRNKRDVAERLARWALAKDYGVAIPYRSPEFKAMKAAGAAVTLTFDFIGGGLRTVDENAVKGFAVCGEDRKWVWATAKITGKDSIEVSAPAVAAPVAVRYAWADNPVCNVFSTEGLPLTPFRTDDFPMITAPKK